MSAHRTGHVHTPTVLFNSTFTLGTFVGSSISAIPESIPNKIPIVSFVALYTFMP
jgi:hypothetical protein